MCRATWPPSGSAANKDWQKCLSPASLRQLPSPFLSVRSRRGHSTRTFVSLINLTRKKQCKTPALTKVRGPVTSSATFRSLLNNRELIRLLTYEAPLNKNIHSLVVLGAVWECMSKRRRTSCCSLKCSHPMMPFLLQSLQISHTRLDSFRLTEASFRPFHFTAGSLEPSCARVPPSNVTGAFWAFLNGSIFELSPARGS